MPKFIIYEEICSAIDADDYEHAIEVYSNLSHDERNAAYLTSNVEVDMADD